MDPFNLDRFVEAQEHTYGDALSELRAGRKRSHWMWFVFPQVAGLGASEMSRRFAIRTLDEARAYLAHPMLGSRLIECCEAVCAHEGLSAHEIFGSPDDLKLRSSATLFDAVRPHAAFERLLGRYFNGERDPATIQFLGVR
jgi:uncharacterized protein (DUF1810 family)